ncbi:pantoate--beta-alanine ligase [Ilyobacter polytropus]|uniref:Pantothenate synthetase n=1 Tax=Ilyobacter polytropus (strain ATCC 51220 / DSM 2926 / LMG 16218 / CuHBu1) TaxID=572544 RepID=E3H7X1_ILYPC|nr:pantoate--beta-alanine ligase [Ilyobacter polytropus]ADO82923.1 pantothenate synthetase [Ilyobacter polytropus DSM 2926]
MEVLRSISEIKEKVNEWKSNGLSVGFVPTMGYLHAGHKSLIEKASSENDRVVVSVFVNPKQFDNENDLETYPSNLQGDKALIAGAGGDIIFAPTAAEMYPDGFATLVDIEGLDKELCGATRPGHFRGVCTVVTKLFLIVTPDRAYFGEKDFQQLAIIKRFTKDLNIPVEIIGCPIVREEDGLAMSSRNAKLSEEERRKALIIIEALNIIKEMVYQGTSDVEELKKEASRKISTMDIAKIDYFEIVDPDTLEKIDVVKEKALAATAVFIGKTRLIDNMIIGE